jgi:hypothetical protein
LYAVIHLIIGDPEVKILTERLNYHPIVLDYLKIFGLEDRLVYVDSSKTYKGEIVYTSCATPTYHTFLSRFAKKIFLSSGLSKKHKANILFYF